MDALGTNYDLLVSGFATLDAGVVSARGVADAYNEAANFRGFIDGCLDSEAKISPTEQASLLLRDMLVGINTDCAKFGVDNDLSSIKDAKTFAQYHQYGAGGPWGCFLLPNSAVAYAAIMGKGAASAWPGAKLVSSPVNANLGSRIEGSAFVAGDDIDTDLYAGAAILNLTSASITGSGVVTVIGDGYDADGVFRQDLSWNLAVSGNTTAAMTPNVAGSLLRKCTDIIIPAGITDGTFTVKAAAPR